MNMMELDGLAADVDALFGISGLKEDLMDVAYIGVSAGVAVVGFEFLYTKVAMLQTANPWVKAGVAVAAGAAGGIAAGRYVHKAVGAGIAAGLIGWGIAKAIQKAAKLEGMASLGQMSDRDLLLGMGAVDNNIMAQDYRPLPGQTSGLEVDDYSAMPGQSLSGGGNVYTSDLQPTPGTGAGNNAYLAALS